MKLLNQVALVTGAATGIGRATALALAREGADIVVNYSKSEAEARETAAAVETLGRRALLARADVANEHQVLAMVDQTVAAFDRLDVLVNNAGTTVFVPFRDLDALKEEAWDRVMAVNVKGTFLCSRAASKVMLALGGGCIVNVASMSGLKPDGSSVVYCASKAGVVSLTKTLAIALAPTIRVNAVAPGRIDTRWNEQRPKDMPRRPECAVLGRRGTAEDVAEVILSLVANAAFVTGQVLLVDGGELP